MIQNYIRVAIRNLLRQRLYSLINVMGLAVGVAACVIVILFLQQEFAYNAHYRDVDHIYRITRERNPPNSKPYRPLGVQGPVGPALLEEIPEIIEMTRFLKRPMWAGRPDRGFNVFGAVGDDYFLSFFGFEVLAGDPEAMKQPWTVFITESFARKMYGDGKTVGETLQIDWKWLRGDFRVAGILADQPKTTSSELKFDLVAHYSSMAPIEEGRRIARVWERWRPTGPDANFIVLKQFVRLENGARLADVVGKLEAFARKHMGNEVAERDPYHIFPLSTMHVMARQYGLALERFEEPFGDINQCYAFALVGLFILAIACINFVNLSTARAAKRALEVGVRKAVGATRSQLWRQFIGEAIVISLVASSLAVVLAWLALPQVNDLLRRSMEVTAQVALLAILIALAVGFAAGSYPAFFLSSLNAVNVLKGSGQQPRSSSRLREVLVVFQFAVSIVLIIATIVAHRQTNLIHQKDLGFHREGRIVVPIFMSSRSLLSQFNAVRERFGRHPSILKVGTSNYPPGVENDVDKQYVHRTSFGDSVQVHFLLVDENYQDVYEIPLLEGRKFVGADLGRGGRILVNETAAAAFDPPIEVGATVRLWNNDSEVVGVFADYHNATLHRKIGPLMFICADWGNYLNLHVKTDQLTETIAFLKESWEAFLPNYPFQYQFVDEYMDRFYKSELRSQKAYTILSGLAIFVACLGLLGLISYTTEVRTKEIGIRKAIGSTSGAIVRLLLKDFAKLIAFATLIACPVAFLISREWLAGFTYRIALGPDVFLLGGLTALGIAILTIGGQAAKAAMRAPSESLRSE